ncbi:MAG: toxin HicA [Raoultibacter sp.]
MPTVENIVKAMRANSKDVKFADCLKVCVYYFSPFGEPRVNGSHHIFHKPWKDDPRINIQNRKGSVASYQVKQVIAAIDKLEGEQHV